MLDSVIQLPGLYGRRGTLDSRDLDLHGKTWPEALEEFVEAYNKAVQPGGHTCRILRVIHGYGSTGGPGILRTRFRKFLESTIRDWSSPLAKRPTATPAIP